MWPCSSFKLNCKSKQKTNFKINLRIYSTLLQRLSFESKTNVTILKQKILLYEVATCNCTLKAPALTIVGFSIARGVPYALLHRFTQLRKATSKDGTFQDLLHQLPLMQFVYLKSSHVSTKGAFTLNAKQRGAKVGHLREWSHTSLAQNKPTIQNQFCLREVKQSLAKFATG